MRRHHCVGREGAIVTYVGVVTSMVISYYADTGRRGFLAVLTALLLAASTGLGFGFYPA
jgi:hypothetical protein